MILTATVLLFMLASVSVYALIASRKNYLVIFVLTPIILVSSVYSGYTLYALQGTPIVGAPSGEVEIVWVELSFPDILFLARNTDVGGEPKYYRIPYTEHNREQMQRAIDGIDNDNQAIGTFTSQDSDANRAEDFDFIPPDSSPLPPKPAGNESTTFNLYPSR